MKKLLLALLATGLVLFYFACKEDSTSLPNANEELLIDQIAQAQNVSAMGVAELPATIPAYVQQNTAPFDIEMALLAPNLGYEVMLENGVCVFFDMNGQHQNHDGLHGDEGNYHGGGMDGFNHCLAGDTLDLNTVPTAINTYLAGNYPGNTVEVFIVKPSGKLGVELSNGIVLMFYPDGAFIHVCENLSTGGANHWQGMMGDIGWQCDTTGMGGMNHGGMGGTNAPNVPCWGGSTLTTVDLPAAIGTYVSTNYPDETVVGAMITFTGNYFLRLSNCTRLVFDADGNILFDSGN